MTKRNLIILITLLIIISVFSYFYFFQSVPTPRVNEEPNFLSKFNPFGSSKPAQPTNEEPTEEPVNNEEEPVNEVVATSNLRKVSSMAISGYGIFRKERFKEIPEVIPTTPTTEEGSPTSTTSTSKPTPPATEFVTALRYVAKTTGNVYQAFADTIDERKFSNTTIPNVYEAYFGSNAESVIMRYLNTDNVTIETFLGSIPKEVLGADTSEENEIKGSFLPQNITDVSIASDGLKAFYLLNIGESAIGTSLTLLDNKKNQIFDSPFTEWLSFWPNSKMITLTTKPSGNVLGYMYMIDPAVKKLVKVLGDITGLTTLTSPNAKLVVFSSSNLQLNTYDIATKVSTSLGVSTLPEKCVWNKLSIVVYCAVPKSTSTAVYPDAWYKGEVSFSDQIWKIDTTNGNTEMLIDPSAVDGGGEVDGIKLGLDENEQYLFFVNKKDSILWELKLN